MSALCPAPSNAVAVYADAEDPHSLVTCPIVAYLHQDGSVRALIHSSEDTQTDELVFASIEEGFLGLGFVDEHYNLLAHDDWADLGMMWHETHKNYVPPVDDPDLYLEEELEDR